MLTCEIRQLYEVEASNRNCSICYVGLELGNLLQHFVYQHQPSLNKSQPGGLKTFLCRKTSTDDVYPSFLCEYNILSLFGHNFQTEVN